MADEMKKVPISECEARAFEQTTLVSNTTFTGKVDAIERLEAENARLREALAFYANEEDWREFRSDEAASAFDRDFGSKLGYDMGERARAALSKQGTEDG